MEELLKTAEVALRLRVSVATVNRYARIGALKAYTLPGDRGQRRYRAEDVEALLNGGAPANEPTEASA